MSRSRPARSRANRRRSCRGGQARPGPKRASRLSCQDLQKIAWRLAFYCMETSTSESVWVGGGTNDALPCPLVRYHPAVTQAGLAGTQAHDREQSMKKMISSVPIIIVAFAAALPANAQDVAAGKPSF